MIPKTLKKKSYWGKILLNCFIPKEFKANKFFVIIEILSQLQVFASLLVFMQIFGLQSTNEFIGEFLIGFFKALACNPTMLLDTVFSSFNSAVFLVLLIYIIANLGFLALFFITHINRTNVDEKLGLAFKIFYNLHSKILFLPSTGLLIEILSRSVDDPSKLLLGSALSSSLKWIIYVLLFLNFVLALFPAFLNFQPLRTDFYFSHRPCSIDFLDLLFKVMSILLIQIAGNMPMGRWLYIFLTYIVLGYKMRTVLKFNPFHHLRAQRLMLAFYTSQICTNTLNVLFILLEDVTRLETIIVLLLIIPLMTSGVMAFYKLDIERLVSSTTVDLQEAHAKILAVSYILDFSNFQYSARISHKFHKEELIFMEMLKTHSLSCTRTKCYCKYFYTKNPYTHVQHASDIHEDLTNFKFNHLKDTYQTIVDIGGDQCDVWVLLDYVALIMTLQPEAFSLILCKIYNLKLDKLSKLERFFVNGMISRVIKDVNSTISNINSQLDANRFFEFKQNSIDFRASLLAATDLCLNFWNNYKQLNPEFMKILQQSREINGKFKVIAKKWLNLKHYFGVLLFKEFKMYSTFLSLVENSTKASRDLMFEFNAYIKNKLQAKDSTEHITRSTIQEERNVTVHINMNFPNVGQIIFTSNNIKNVFGWHAKELVGCNVNKIIPDFMKDFHTQKLLDHLKSGVNKKVFKNYLIFAKHSLGHIAPSFLYVTPHPDLELGFSYIGVLRPTRRRNEYIITDNKMRVMSWTEEIGKELALIAQKTLIESCSKENMQSVINLSKFYENDGSLKLDGTAHQDGEMIEKFQSNGEKCKIEFSGSSGMTYSCEIDPIDKINIPNYNLLSLERSYNRAKKLKTSDDGEFESCREQLDDESQKINQVVYYNPKLSYRSNQSPLQVKNEFLKTVSNELMPTSPTQQGLISKSSFPSSENQNNNPIKVNAKDNDLVKIFHEVDKDTVKDYGISSDDQSQGLRDTDNDDFKFHGASIAATSVTSKASSARIIDNFIKT